MTLKNVKVILNLVVKNEANAILLKDIENYLLKETYEFKRTVQQLQQAVDTIENLKLEVVKSKHEYKELIHYKIINKINHLLEEIRFEILKLKVN